MLTKLQNLLSFQSARLVAIHAGFAAFLFTFAPVSDAQIEGFTEPLLSIDLSSDEAGAIAELRVEEGDSIAKGDVIARLDDRVQKIQLDIATQMANASSQLKATEQTLEKRRLIHERLTSLQGRGHASESELIRSDMELSIAESKYNAAREERAVREIEQRRAEVQLSRRSIVAPIHGVISTVHRHEGEFLSPLRPEIVTIIQVDRLLSTFAIPVSQAREFAVGKEFELKFENGNTVVAKVYSMSVSTDAQSQTVEIKLVFDNRNNEFRAGELCILNI